jgi:hypothetical protein
MPLVQSHRRFLHIGTPDDEVDLCERLDAVQALANNKWVKMVDLLRCSIDEHVIATLMQSNTITGLMLPDADEKMCELLAANTRLTFLSVRVLSLSCLRILVRSTSITQLLLPPFGKKYGEVVRLLLTMPKLMTLSAGGQVLEDALR